MTSVIIALALAGNAQKLAKPTKTSSPPTPAQQALIREGIALHDAKKYDAAIAKYQAVLLENPDCTAAMYEMAYSLSARGQDEKAIELANIGSKYICDELPIFYVLMANIVDSHYKQPEAAIKIYKEGLKLLNGNSQFASYRSSLNFNMGVTYFQQEKYAEAKSAFKAAVEDDRRYASPNFLLSRVYNGLGYKIPALFAASRFISLEYTSERSRQAAAIIAELLKAPSKDPKSGKIQITLAADSPKDEGDFAVLELMLSLAMVATDENKDKKMTEDERFVSSLSSLFAMAAEDKKLRSTFVGKQYVPFFVEMEKNGFTEVLGYLTLFLNGKPEARDWLRQNDVQLKKFIAWSKAY
jgi:tetratricopeptide (TPR) repeat protein